MTKHNWEKIYNEANAAGMEAGSAHTPTPMIVGHETSFMSGKIDYSRPTHQINEGVCGFAWVIVKDGRSSFARWLKKENHGRKHYYGGTCISPRGFGQSMERKEAWANAFADVLKLHGIDCYVDSRMD